MLVPMSWLREFTPYEGTAEMLGERLTMLGLELDGIVNPFADIADIIVGFVAQCVPHPNSDHMRCCKVDIGQGELVDIVCGAPNVASGQKVAVAPVGARLPGGAVIKKAKLRGEPSNGMICSERELGLSDDHNGIMVLPDSLDVGHTLIAALELDTEVLDLSVTPNRSDCLSILGVARETAAAYGLRLHAPEIPLIMDEAAEKVEIPIQIDSPELCSLYAGRVITGSQAAPSPLRMRCRLHAVGIRAISNLVDVTNYIMIECGQPLHAFDLDKVAGRRIIVRLPKAGEKIVTLDGKERNLAPEDLCICDQEKPIALAGVMGGANSEIDAATQNIFLESAVFNPRSIRKTSRRLGLQSEASYRFERGIDQMRSIWSLERAAALMASICGGNVRIGFALNEPRPFVPVHIAFSPQRADRLLGVEIPGNVQKKTLADLGCAVDDSKNGAWSVSQPSWRPDLTREADLVEEVGRFYGLDRIEPVIPPVQKSLEDNLGKHGKFEFGNLVRQWGSGLGLHEIISYSFVGQKDLDLLNLPKEDRLAILNPLSEDQDALRSCLAPGLLQALANNLAFEASGARIFELANAFAADAASETGARETFCLGILLSGARHDNPWPRRDEDFAYADIKGLLENLFSYLHLPSPALKTADDHPYLLPCVEIILNGLKCGCMGRVKPAIARVYNAQKTVWLLELELEPMRFAHEHSLMKFRPLPIYPSAKRDITLKADMGLHVDQILEKIQLLNIPILEGAVLADCFENPDAHERNLTFRLTFRHPQRTLKDAEADRERENIAQLLCKELPVSL